MKLQKTILLLTIIFLCSGITYSQTATAPAVGDGSVESPYQIATLNNLYWLTQNSTEWNKHYIQTADIDASTTSTWAPNGSGGFYGFSPIGNGTTQFAGSYDGEFHTIDALFINRPSTNYIGLFGFIKYNASVTIENLGVTNVNITGFSTFGGLIGESWATINNCYVSGTMICNGDYVGGLVGSNRNSISKCYTTGSVSGNNRYVGGLVGYNDGTISNSYNTASVNGTREVGGLVGVDYDGTLNNCYSTGLITNNDTGNKYGLIGDVHGTTITNSFWDTETSGTSTSSGGTGKTTDEMQTLATFTAVATTGLTTAWDFETNPNDDAANNDYWDMDISTDNLPKQGALTKTTLNDGYPFLNWQNGDDTALPVELTTFTASVVNNNVQLDWQTATEVNNYGFSVERASTPLSMKDNVIPSGDEGEKNTEVWETLDFVEGHGNSNSPKFYEYLDNTVNSGKYLYRLKQIDIDGSFEYSDVIEVDVNIILPIDYSLSQNYPNPFNPVTTIKYTIPTNVETLHATSVHLKVYDILGNKIATLVNEEKQPGVYEVTFDASELTSGVYYYQLIADNYFAVKRMVLLK